MDINSIKGAGGLERGPERSAKSERAAGGDAARPVQSDSAAISHDGRAAHGQVAGLAERAQQEDPDREAKVAAAKARLDAGDYTREQVLESTAKRMLASGF